jgi:hypothetical protein
MKLDLNQLKDWRIYARLIILLIFAGFIYSQLPSPEINTSELDRSQNETNQTLILPQSISVIDTPKNFEELIWQILYAESKREICFEDRGSYSYYADGVVSYDVTTSISYQDKEYEVNPKKCFPIPNEQKQISFNWVFNGEFIAQDVLKHGGSIAMHPNVRSYILLKGFWGKLFTFILIIFLTGIFLRMFKEAYNYVRKGWSD